MRRKPWIALLLPVIGTIAVWYGGKVHAQSIGIFVAAGQQAVTGTAAALPSQANTVLCVKGVPGNSLTIYIGGSTVTTSTGYPLAASESACFPIVNANRLYVIASSTGSSIAWFATNNPSQP